MAAMRSRPLPHRADKGYTPEMHWFWRVAIAMGAGCVFSGLFHFVQYSSGLWSIINRAVTPLTNLLPWGRSTAHTMIVDHMPLLIAAFSVYGFLTVRWGPHAAGNETRCRNCNYILRGITEPRCPECGARI